ncbi:hypothetical protein HYT55_05300 [Candidatus Woesearchaeota archaeon]|nr:hypothetical protein [Candidatus Woesearchaeota archaeon]
MSDDNTPINLQERRAEKTKATLLEVLGKAYASLSDKPLLYQIGLQCASPAIAQRDLPILLETLAVAKPRYWNFFFAIEEAAEFYHTHPELHPPKNRDAERLRDKETLPLTWALATLKTEGYLSAIRSAKINFRAKDNKQFYLESVLHIPTEEKANPLLKYSLHLRRDLLRQNAACHQFVLETAIYNAEIGGRIFQDVCRALTPGDDWLVACTKSDWDNDITEGFVFQLAEFATFDKAQLLGLRKEIIDRLVTRYRKK